MGINYNPRTITDGLVLCLDAANPKSYSGSGATWSDLSGNGNNGTLVNGVGYSGDNLGSLVFDGVDDSSQLQFQFTNTYTININIKFIGATTGNRAIIDLGNQTPSIRLYLQDSKLKIQHEGAFASLGVLTTQNVPTNIWKSYTITGNESFCQIFDNGALNNFGSVGGPPRIQLSEMGIADKPTSGSGSSTSISPLNCFISQILIYNKVLTPQEIQQNFNATKGRYGL
jgi:hypothetical protein